MNDCGCYNCVQAEAALRRNTKPALVEIAAEMRRQVELWGIQDHAPAKYFLILAEEFGEVSKEVCEIEHELEGLGNLRGELIQLAAVAASMVEAMDRAAESTGLVSMSHIDCPCNECTYVRQGDEADC